MRPLYCPLDPWLQQLGWKRYHDQVRLRNQNPVERAHLQQASVPALLAHLAPCLRPFLSQPGGQSTLQVDLQHGLEDLARCWLSY